MTRPLTLLALLLGMGFALAGCFGQRFGSSGGGDDDDSAGDLGSAGDDDSSDSAGDDDAGDDDAGDDDLGDDDLGDDDLGDDDLGDDDAGDDDSWSGDDDAGDDDSWADDDAGDDDTAAFDQDGDGLSEHDGDCDDTDPAVHPGATEVANGIDDDCDGVVDEGTHDYDDDGDGWSENEGDCDDSDPARHPGAPEDGGTGTGAGNLVDDDCDGYIDEGTTGFDDDGDGYSELQGDCDDFNGSRNPGQFEDPSNGIDDDCDGAIDEVLYCDCPSTNDLAAAVDVCEGLLGATPSGPAYGVTNNYGPYGIRGGCHMIWLSTGVPYGPFQPGTDYGATGSSGDRSALLLTLAVPAWSSSFSFDFNFMSSEYPEWLNQGYNDYFFATLGSSAFNGNISFDSFGTPIEIDNAFFSVTNSTQLTGTGMQNGVGGGTGWLTTTAPVTPGETITLEFSIADIGDGIYDSIVLVDNFRWGVDTLTDPVTQQ